MRVKTARLSCASEFLGSQEEFRMHLKAALNNGVTPEQIKEVLLQTAIYCGVPAANQDFHIANEVIGAK